MLGLWITLAVIVLIFIFLVSIYNKLVTRRIETENAWSQIDVQLKRRYDLIPNLVETVKGYAAHERETLENVVKARQTAIDAGNVKDQAQAENMLSGALGKIFALSEAYPNLKANENFMQLQEELGSTENKISYARQFYNDTVSQFNTAVQKLPANLVANMFGFKSKEFFEVGSPEQREVVKVKF